MSKKFINLYFFILLFFIITCNIFFAQNQNFTIPNNEKEFLESNFHYNKDSEYSWPVFGYYSISSYFGKRKSPVSRCFFISFTEQIFLLQLEQLFILFVLGTVIYTGFYGADGYTIIIENNNIQVLYAHTSPNFIVRKNQKIHEKEKIGIIGPKYIDTPENTKYFDSNGKKTNGSLTGPHLHITIKKDGKAVNPLDFL